MKDTQRLLPVRYQPHREEWIGQPMVPFRPRGLMIWGAPDGAWVRQVLCGANMQLVVDCGDLPARWFSQADSYEQIAKAVDAGKEPPAWGAWDVITPGQLLRITLTHHDGVPLDDRGGLLQMLVWGVADYGGLGRRDVGNELVRDVHGK